MDCNSKSKKNPCFSKFPLNGNTTYYVYDGNVVIEEQDADNEESARNVYGRNLITRETSDGVVVYAYNGHSDVVAICNLDGDTLVTYEYDEFGNVISEAVVDEDFANFDNPYRYAGYEYIDEVKLYDLNARYYNPEIARFLSQDPYYDLGNRVIGLYEINDPNAWSIMQTTVLYAYCGNCPTVFDDPSGCFSFPKISISKEMTRNIARSIIANPIFVSATQSGKYAHLFNIAGFSWNSTTKTYHANVNAWQQIGGYNDLYDVVFDYATNMEKDSFEFSYNDRKYIFWVWKGDYLNMGAGAELGIYSNESGIAGKIDVSSPHDEIWLVDTNLAMKMSLSVIYDGQEIISYTPDEKQWWITGFNPYYQDIDVNKLDVTYTVQFEDSEMFEAFREENLAAGWNFETDSLTATFDF